MGSCLGPRVGLDAVKKRKYISQAWNRTLQSRLQFVALPTELSGSYASKALGTHRSYQNGKAQRIHVKTAHCATDGILLVFFSTKYSDVITIFTDGQEKREK
jgi:transposase